MERVYDSGIVDWFKQSTKHQQPTAGNYAALLRPISGVLRYWVQSA